MFAINRNSALGVLVTASFVLFGASRGEAQSLRITGVVDGPLSGGIPKAIELYADADIADLSEYGIGAANNGGGSDGEEFTFFGTATQGQFFYLATEATGFESFFGFPPDFTNGTAASINGDDAIELFHLGVVADVFGDINVDGTGTPWDYLDGWVYRVSGTGPDGGDFLLGNWTYGGVDALDGEVTNGSAALPFPFGSFEPDGGTDLAPYVVGTTPTDGATGVALDASVVVEFSEPVTTSDPWFEIDCGVSGMRSATTTGGPTTLTLTIDGDLAETETCVVTVLAGQVLDAATNALAADYEFSFETTGPSGCSAPATPVYAVQGAGAESPLVGQTVTLEAVVTGDFQSADLSSDDLAGFFVQDEMGDRDPLTSDGVFVYDPSTVLDVDVGDRVRVVGVVGEYFGETQVTVAQIEKCGVGSVALTDVALPSPQVVVNADGRWIADLEQFEGMWVRFPAALTVTEMFNLDRFGEMRLAAGGRLEQFTNAHQPDAAGFADHLQAIAARTVMLDDGLRTQNPTPIRFPSPGLSTANAPRMGDTVSELQGNLRFSRGSGGSGDELFRLMPTSEPEFVGANARPEAAPAVGGSLHVASFNVLNFFTTLDVSGSACFPSGGRDQCRGADSPDEYARQLDKLVTALIELNADIYGLVEVENDANEGPATSLNLLVQALHARNDRSCAQYDYVETGAPIGGDAIAVALLYCTDAVELAVGTTPAVLTDAALSGLGFPTSEPVFDGQSTSRAPLAATFEQLTSGEVLTVAVNHFKSKGDSGLSCPDPSLDANCDQGDGQGYWNARRTLAAEAVALWLSTAPTGSDDPDVLLVGDLNAYLLEEPVQTLEAAGYVNLVPQFGDAATYSYVFDGQLGALDHALGSPSLVAQVAGAAEWHVNADEADALDYNLDFGRPSDIFDGTLPFRNSDHDPLLVGLTLGAALTCDCSAPGAILGTDDRDILAGTPGPDIICALGGNDIVLGLGGDDCIDLGSGNDLGVGGGGRDKLYGGPGDDRLLGGPGDDLLDGGDGQDVLNGASGADQCVAGERALSCTL